MSLERRTAWWLKTDAVISWIVALPGLADPVGVATFFGAEEPTWAFLVRLWSGLLFLFGWVSWGASRRVGGDAALLRYIWIEKGIVAITVLVGHLDGEAPPSLMGLILLTNLPWIPPLLHADLAMRRRTRREAGGTEGLAVGEE